MTTYSFSNPELLWLLAIIPLIAFLHGRVGPIAAICFSSTQLIGPSGKIKRAHTGRLLFTLRLLALSLLIVGLARPQKGEGFSEQQASGIDIVLAVDVSGSMLALDFTQSNDKLITRLDAAKDVILEFVKKRSSDRIGLIAFSRYPYLVSPLTLNHDWLEKNIDRLQTGIGEDGTAIGSAVGMSVNRLRDLPSKSRVIILLTDGANNAGKISPIAASEAAASFDTKIYTIAAGVGGIVPIAVTNSEGQIVHNAWGQPLIERAHIPIDETTLQEMANITGGKFYRARDIQELSGIYDEINALEKTEVKLRRYASYEELFQWFVLPALGLILLEFLLRYFLFKRLP